MKSVLMASLLTALLPAHTPTNLLAQPDKLPDRCPSVTSIAAQGLDYVIPFPGLLWSGVKEKSHYDTTDNWTFLFIDDYGTNNGKVALQTLSQRIRSSHLESGPKWDSRSGRAYCEYEVPEGGKDNMGMGYAFMPSFYD